MGRGAALRGADTHDLVVLTEGLRHLQQVLLHLIGTRSLAPEALDHHLVVLKIGEEDVLDVQETDRRTDE